MHRLQHDSLRSNESLQEAQDKKKINEIMKEKKKNSCCHAHIFNVILLLLIIIIKITRRKTSSDFSGASVCMSDTKYVMNKRKSDVIFASQSHFFPPTLESRG